MCSRRDQSTYRIALGLIGTLNNYADRTVVGTIARLVDYRRHNDEGSLVAQLEWDLERIGLMRSRSSGACRLNVGYYQVVRTLVKTSDERSASSNLLVASGKFLVPFVVDEAVDTRNGNRYRGDEWYTYL